jgi:tetratricopeptide (TPR) repeat protein
MCILARYEEALTAVESALDIEKDPLYRLTRGEILGHQGHYDEAVQETRGVLSVGSLPRDLKAKGICQLGDLVAASPAHDYKQAMEDHLAAIKLADPLSIDKRLQVRRTAKLLLVDAHLAVANDIAGGYWQQKEKVVPKWLERARGYAEDLIAHEDADAGLRLHLAQGALAACAGSEGKVDSVPWARMALQAAKPLITVADDPWTKLALQWELGVALSDGLVADELRGAVQHALPNTALTITYMESGAKGRQETPADAFRLGWIYYRMGSLHAVQHTDHKTAVAWYEKAFPLLDRPIPPTLRNQQGHCGEWLVSMGISYWEEGNRNFALQVTDAGAQHVKEAVQHKLMDENGLAIPYGNLAFMHEALGHKEEAQNFAKLAAKFDNAETSKH